MRHRHPGRSRFFGGLLFPIPPTSRRHSRAVVYNNNRRAILALEKGTPGERVFAEAFKAWNQQAAKR